MNSTTITAPHTQAEIFKRFAIYGDLVSFKSFGGGHINGTYLSVWNQAGTSVRYTHQRINKNVFTNPAAVVENIQRITEHIAAKLTAEAEPAATIANQGAAAGAAAAESTTTAPESQASAEQPLANVSVSKPGSDETVEAAAHTQHKAAPPAATASAATATLEAASRPAAHTALAAKSAAAANHGTATTAINQTAAATAPCTATKPTPQPGTAAVPVSRQVLTLIPAKDGRYFYLDSAGEYWRTYLFIEDAATYDRMENPALARFPITAAPLCTKPYRTFIICTAATPNSTKPQPATPPAASQKYAKNLPS